MSNLFFFLPICSRRLKLIPPSPSGPVKSVPPDFHLSVHKMKHLFVYHAKKGPSLRTTRVGQNASRASAAALTNLNSNHVPELPMWYVKNAVCALKAFGR